MFMTIDCDNGGFVYPATTNSRICAAPTNAAPMGSRVQLDMTPTEIFAFAMPAWKQTILRAMAEYGDRNRLRHPLARARPVRAQATC
jgi:hypothetical protein